MLNSEIAAVDDLVFRLGMQLEVFANFRFMLHDLIMKNCVTLMRTLSQNEAFPYTCNLLRDLKRSVTGSVIQCEIIHVKLLPLLKLKICLPGGSILRPSAIVLRPHKVLQIKSIHVKYHRHRLHSPTSHSLFISLCIEV